MLTGSSLVLAVISWRSATAFVNVPQVRKPALQSTSTSVTWEPAHVLTDAFNRNPFATDEESQTTTAPPVTLFGDGTSTGRSAKTYTAPRHQHWFSALGTGIQQQQQRHRRPSSLVAKYIQSKRARRKLQAELKVSLDNFLRDSGLLRSIMDFLVTIGTPSLILDNREILPRFFQLTRDCIRIPYGDKQQHWTQAFQTYGHQMQAIEMYLPENDNKLRGLLFFVHGGAWGSGLPWMYRLIAQPFLDEGMAVAVVGYRTFPDGDVKDQVADLETAADKLTELYPDLCTKESDFGVCVMGHSSGAHISMSMLANRLQQKLQLDQQSATGTDKPKMKIDSFIGLSAPYEISSHYEFETGRGLEEVSPMKAACGYDKERLSDYSPALQLFQQMIKCPLQVCQQVNEACPRIALIHGDQDETVPYTSTQQAAQLLSVAGITKCDEIYLSETGHSDTVLELMFGGKTKEMVMNWLQQANALHDAEPKSQSDTESYAEQRLTPSRASKEVSEPALVVQFQTLRQPCKVQHRD